MKTIFPGIARWTRIFHTNQLALGGTGHWPVPCGDPPDGTGATWCSNSWPEFIAAAAAFRPASGQKRQAGRPCHPVHREISRLIPWLALFCLLAGTAAAAGGEDSASTVRESVGLEFVSLEQLYHELH